MSSLTSGQQQALGGEPEEPMTSSSSSSRADSTTVVASDGVNTSSNTQSEDVKLDSSSPLTSLHIGDTKPKLKSGTSSSASAAAVASPPPSDYIPPRIGSKKGQGGWTAVDDQLLLTLAQQRQQCDPSNNDYKCTWSKIAASLGKNYTADQCYERWCKVLDPSLKKGPWTEDEDQRIQEGYRIYGHFAQDKWSKIAEHVGSRNGKQVRERWINHLDPEICHDPWTHEEEVAVVRYYLGEKKTWTEMIGLLPSPNGKHRPANAIKNVFNTRIKGIIGTATTVDAAINNLEQVRNGRNVQEPQAKKRKTIGGTETLGGVQTALDHLANASASSANAVVSSTASSLSTSSNLSHSGETEMKTALPPPPPPPSDDVVPSTPAPVALVDVFQSPTNNAIPTPNKAQARSLFNVGGQDQPKSHSGASTLTSTTVPKSFFIAGGQDLKGHSGASTLTSSSSSSSSTTNELPALTSSSSSTLYIGPPSSTTTDEDVSKLVNLLGQQWALIAALSSKPITSQQCESMWTSMDKAKHVRSVPPVIPPTMVGPLSTASLSASSSSSAKASASASVGDAEAATFFDAIFKLHGSKT